jgi:N-glycosylase/DNA lyase
VAGFPSVSYWLYRVFERRLTNTAMNYKLGKSLLEEIGACLLGGHGIPAERGLAAYEHMKLRGAFNGILHTNEQLYNWLSEPIEFQGKTFRYRFAKQKAKYLNSAIEKIIAETPPTESGKELRNWLTKINGIGLKTASWIARNWLDADDVAILDIHIYRAGILGGFFKDNLTVERHYLELEEQFLALASSMDVRASELDALMWFEMQESSTVLKQLEVRNQTLEADKPMAISDLSSDHSSTYAQQLALL